MLAIVFVVICIAMNGYQRYERHVEGLMLRAPNAKVTRVIFREGTNRVFLETAQGDKVTVVYNDSETTVGSPQVRFGLESLNDDFPACEAQDQAKRYEHFLAFVDYAMLTEYADRIHDFSSLMKNIDEAKKFLHTYFGPDPEHPKFVNSDGTVFLCYLRRPT